MQTEPQPTTPPVADGLLEKIKNFLLQNYQPVHHQTSSTILLSTREIYENLQHLYPSLGYAPDNVAQWLHEAGFTFTEISDLRFEWMLQKAS